MNPRFYWKNTAGWRLTDEGVQLVRNQLNELKCPSCGGWLYLVRMMECEFVDCATHKYCDEVPCNPKFDISFADDGPVVALRQPKPHLDKIWLNRRADGEMEFRLDWSNDRHHAVTVVGGRGGKEAVAAALMSAARLIDRDPTL